MIYPVLQELHIFNEELLQSCIERHEDSVNEIHYNKYRRLVPLIGTEIDLSMMRSLRQSNEATRYSFVSRLSHQVMRSSNIATSMMATLIRKKKLSRYIGHLCRVTTCRFDTRCELDRLSETQCSMSAIAEERTFPAKRALTLTTPAALRTADPRAVLTPRSPCAGTEIPHSIKFLIDGE